MTRFFATVRNNLAPLLHKNSNSFIDRKQTTHPIPGPQIAESSNVKPTDPTRDRSMTVDTVSSTSSESSPLSYVMKDSVFKDSVDSYDDKPEADHHNPFLDAFTGFSFLKPVHSHWNAKKSKTVRFAKDTKVSLISPMIVDESGRLTTAEMKHALFWTREESIFAAQEAIDELNALWHSHGLSFNQAKIFLYQPSVFENMRTGEISQDFVLSHGEEDDSRRRRRYSQEESDQSDQPFVHPEYCDFQFDDDENENMLPLEDNQRCVDLGHGGRYSVGGGGRGGGAGKRACDPSSPPRHQHGAGRNGFHRNVSGRSPRFCRLLRSNSTMADSGDIVSCGPAANRGDGGCENGGGGSYAAEFNMGTIYEGAPYNEL